MLAGTYTKKVGAKNSLRLVAAPTIYGQVVFEESGECEISEWVVNYDLATALISRNADAGARFVRYERFAHSRRPLRSLAPAAALGRFGRSSRSLRARSSVASGAALAPETVHGFGSRAARSLCSLRPALPATQHARAHFSRAHIWVAAVARG